MRFLIPLAVIASFLLSSAIMIDAIWPSLYSVQNWQNAPLHLIPFFIFPAWPWTVSFFISFSKKTAYSSLFVAVAGFLLVVAFHSTISAAPTEGKGYYVIFFVLLSWVLFPLSLIFEKNNSE